MDREQPLQLISLWPWFPPPNLESPLKMQMPWNILEEGTQCFCLLHIYMSSPSGWAFLPLRGQHSADKVENGFLLVSAWSPRTRKVYKLMEALPTCASLLRQFLPPPLQVLLGVSMLYSGWRYVFLLAWFVLRWLSSLACPTPGWPAFYHSRQFAQSHLSRLQPLGSLWHDSHRPNGEPKK